MQVQYVVQYFCNENDFVTLSRYKTREIAEQGYGRYMKVFQNLFRITIEEANYGTRAKRC
jgi:hypothetical protein